jgi:hypothetical protein
MTSAAALIREVFAAGGQIAVDGADLVLTAPRALPDDLLAQIREHKRSILEALARPAEVRRRRVLALARDGRQYAIYIEGRQRPSEEVHHGSVRTEQSY